MIFTSFFPLPFLPLALPPLRPHFLQPIGSLFVSYYRGLWATMWLLGFELMTSGRAVGAPNRWAISSVWFSLHNKSMEMKVIKIQAVCFADLHLGVSLEWQAQRLRADYLTNKQARGPASWIITKAQSYRLSWFHSLCLFLNKPLGDSSLPFHPIYFILV